ncbi:phosphate regulon sensor histidine kinase PhoR [Teredinibacter franksiae]|uniref:phosphate regulon sensor histidine kinase PhoR n=1 Tax=Teredinibacter franksiae TaxID=2761453 RepID=UPI0016251A10|nr:phosphate regulon sensor histidine kinase PhoR [Teredinibacter franksiae]
MFRKGIATELWWLMVYLCVALAIGFMLGAVWPALFLGALVYLGWILYQIQQLEKWVTVVRVNGLRDHKLRGIWGEVAEDIELMIKRADKGKHRLQQVVARVQDMTSALTDGVIIVDNDDNIEWCNRSAERQFDFEPQDIGRKLTNYIRHPTFVSYYDSDEYEEPLDLPSKHHEGEFLQFHIHRFGEGDRLVIVRDITRVANLERMRKDFVANVSHELRTPLTVLGGYLETMVDAADNLPPTWARALDQMRDQTKRMTSLITDLLTLSRLETEDRQTGQEPVSLRPLIEQIIADAKVLSGDHQHVFNVDCEPSIQLVGQENELRSAFANLVYNAVNYTPDGREISVDVELTPLQLIVKIKDNGNGIEPRHLPRLTERFYRIDEGRSRESGGTGLGLSIVKHILMRHDAELRIRSKMHKGSTFSCHFPLKRFTNSSVEQVHS